MRYIHSFQRSHIWFELDLLTAMKATQKFSINSEYEICDELLTTRRQIYIEILLSSRLTQLL